MQKKNRLLHFLAVLGVACACSKPSAEHFNAISVVAYEDGAVVVAAIEKPSGYVLEGLDRFGSRRWRTLLDCDSAPIAVTSNNHVFIHCGASSKTHELDRVSAFALSDGHQVWRHDERAAAQSIRALNIVGDSVVASGDRALVLNASDGSLRLVYPAKEPLRAPVVDGSSIVFVGLDHVVTIDAATGSAATAEFAGTACATRGKLWEVHNKTIAIRPLHDLAAAPVVLDIGMKGAAPMSIEACGSYESSVVLQMRMASGDEISMHVVRLDEKNAVVADLNLGDVEIARTKLLRERAEAAGLNGELQRFSLLALRHATTTMLTLVDLQTATVKPIGYAISDNDIVTVSIFRDGDQWFVTDRRSLSTYSAVTGNVVGTRVSSGYGVLPSGVSPHRVWVASTASVGFSPVARNLGQEVSRPGLPK